MSEPALDGLIEALRRLPGRRFILTNAPAAYTARVFVWNQAAIERAGLKLPTTWDELFAAGKAFQAKNGDKAYLLDGELMMNDEDVAPCSLVVLAEGEAVTLYAEGECQLVLIGGAPLDGPRRMNWNFVASDPELIEQARARWAAGDWPVVPGETSRIELPR